MLGRYTAFTVATLAIVTGCDGRGFEGVDGGVLTFDAAMIASPGHDAGPQVRGDSGAPIPDAGVPLPRDSGPRPQCRGYVTPCSLLGSSQCLSALGCRSDDQCTGYAEACYSQYGNYACISQQGCYWSSSTDSCAGLAENCTSFYGSASCTSQRGCSWHSGCAGVAYDCATFSDATNCLRQPGCGWY